MKMISGKEYLHSSLIEMPFTISEGVIVRQLN